VSFRARRARPRGILQVPGRRSGREPLAILLGAAGPACQRRDTFGTGRRSSDPTASARAEACARRSCAGPCAWPCGALRHTRQRWL